MFKWLLIVSLIIAVSSSEEGPPGGEHLIQGNSGEEAKGTIAMGIKQLTGDDTSAAANLSPETSAGRKLNDYKYPNQTLQKNAVKSLLSKLKRANIEEIVLKLSSFHSRNALVYYGASEAEGWLTKEIKKILANFKGSSSIHFISDPLLANPNGETIPYKQQNIIVRIEGQDSKKKEQLVILGAHYDSIIGFDPAAWRKDLKKRAPGADDNATGVAVLMEVLRLLVQSGTKLKYTLEFHFYTSAEIHNSGALDVAKQYNRKNLKVKGMLNFDSLGHGTTIGFVDKNPNGRQHSSPTLTAFVRMLVKEYTNNVPLKEIDCGEEEYCLLDHYAWRLLQYPSTSIMAFNLSPNRHTERDTFGTVKFELVNEFAKVATAFAVELGEPLPSASALKLEMALTVMGGSLVVIWLLF